MKWNHKWTVQEQANFLRLISELLARGYSLEEAITSLKYQFNEKQGEDLNFCIENLREGHLFSEILKMLKFNSDLIGYVFFAEQHGNFVQALQDGSGVILKRRNDLERLLKLLYYPLILIMFTVMLFAIVDKVLLPKFIALFQTLNIEENFFTKLLLIIGTYSPLVIVMVILFTVIFGFYYFIVFRNKPQILQKSIIVKVPILGQLFRLFYTHFFATQLSYLLAGGLSINNALLVFEKNNEQPFYKQISTHIKLQLVEGVRLENIINDFPFFEHDLAYVLEHGQKNGRLDKELLFYSEHCLERLEEITNKWLKIIQPLLYSLIGFLIVSMYMAVLLPMFKMLDNF